MATTRAMIRHIVSRSRESARNEIALQLPNLLVKSQRYAHDLRGWAREAEECADFLQDDWRPTVFLHIPKCGGTSAANALASHFGERYLHLKRLPDLVEFTRRTGRLPEAITLVHLTLDFFTAVFGARLSPDNLKVFTTTRDPYARFGSLFHYMKRHRFIPKRISPEHLLKALQARPVQPDSFSRNVSLQFAAPQSSYFGEWRKELIDEIPLEDLATGARKLPFDHGAAFSHLNQSPESSAGKMSAAETRFIEDIYREDFAAFNYPFMNFREARS